MPGDLLTHLKKVWVSGQQLQMRKVEPGEGFPAGAQLCGKCNSMAVVQMDGCATCLNCGHSKCG